MNFLNSLSPHVHWGLRLSLAATFNGQSMMIDHVIADQVQAGDDRRDFGY
jgi:hypothetical protein